MAEISLFKNMHLKAILIVVCSCSTIFSLTAQKDDSLKQLMEQAKEAQSNQDYSEALKLYLKGEIIAKKNNNYEQLWFIKNNKGNMYMFLSSYGSALENFNEALDIIDNHPDIASNKVSVLTNIGLMYSNNEKPEKALDIYKKAYALINENSPPYNKFVKVVLAVNMADAYNKTNRPEKAQGILMEVEQEKNKDYANEEIRQGWKINYAETFFLKGEISRAEKMMKELLPKTTVQKERTCYVCILELLSRIYEAQGKPDLAITYTKKGLKEDQKLKNREKLYNQLAHLYTQQEKYKLALVYMDSVIQIKDSLAKKINHQLFAVNKVKLGIQKYQNELKINQEKRKKDFIIFIVIGVLALVLFYTIYIGMRNRMIKQRQTIVIAENQQKIAELELKQEKNEHLLLEKKMTELENKSKLKQEQLKNKISKKNRMLSANALYHSGRNELLEKIISNISAVSENKAINDYIKELKGHLKTDSKWEEFISHFEKVNPGFLKSLKSKHPNLTKKDIRFLCYLYMNLGTKEICDIFNITPQAFWKRKQRLSEKMSLEKGGLYDYILGLT